VCRLLRLLPEARDGLGFGGFQVSDWVAARHQLPNGITSSQRLIRSGTVVKIIYVITLARPRRRMSGSGPPTSSSAGPLIPPITRRKCSVLQNFSITLCDAVRRLAGIRPIAGGPDQP